MSTFVLVHGMAHGSWCWDRVVAGLRAQGHQVVALDLPLTSIDDDVRVVRDARDEVLADVVVGYPPSPLNDHSSIIDSLRVVIDPAGAIEGFYNWRDPSEAAQAAARLRPTALACVSSPAGAEPRRTTRTTYVLCERDNAIHSSMQRWMSARAPETVALDTDHSPFLSAPAELVGVLSRIAAAY